MSGKLNEDWRIGLMDIETGSEDALYDLDGNLEKGAIPSQNYGVLVLQRQVFARSNITASFINRKSFNFTPSKFDSTFTEYNRDIGLEYNLYSSNNLWTGKFLVHKSFTPQLSGDDYFHTGQLAYSSKKIGAEWVQKYVGSNYNAEVGFVPRTGYYEFVPNFRYTFFPKSENLVSHGPEISLDYILDKDFNRTDDELQLGYNFEMLNRSTFGMYVSQNYIRLLNPFDPTNTDGVELQAGSDYSWWRAGINYFSTSKNRFTFNADGSFGGYFNGTLSQVSGGAGYRFQPYGSINIDIEYNDIQLPEPYTSTSFLLISPKLEVTFTNKIYLTTFVQYNEQIDNFNINARFQWRFLPASDIYLVYTENYLTTDYLGTLDFSNKNRALVLKITYWYNI